MTIADEPERVRRFAIMKRLIAIVVVSCGLVVACTTVPDTTGTGGSGTTSGTTTGSNMTTTSASGTTTSGSGGNECFFDMSNFDECNFAE